MTQFSLFSKPAEPSETRIEGVSRVLDYVRRLIAANKTLSGIRVRGEVSGLNERNGRLYFKLKEGEDVLECVAWPKDAAKFVPFKVGDELVCGGEFSAYAPRSQIQLIVRSAELTGSGAIYAQLKQLEEQFRREGLFARERKRPMPEFPQRVAVISARDGKGINDFMTLMAKDAPFVRVEIVPTLVQGEGAEIEIAAAIDRASKMDVDVILLTRGGGSVEDLFPFNKEPVVRAIVRAKHPVMTAIGHNLDIHVSDEVADFHCETPSSAAGYFKEIGARYSRLVERFTMQLERAVRERSVAKSQTFDLLAQRFGHAAQTYVPRRKALIDALERRLQAQTPQRRLAQRAEKLAELQSRLRGIATQRFLIAGREQRLRHLNERLRGTPAAVLRPAAERLRRLDTRLNDLNPRALLARGYAIVMLNGVPLRDASAAPPGSLIEAQLERGTLQARVEGSADA